MVEEEFEHARRTGKSFLILLQDVERDEDGERLASRISDFVDGAFRRTFEAPSDLRDQVEQALTSQIALLQQPQVAPTLISEKVVQGQPFQNEATLRFVLGPERHEEVVDPVELGSEEFFETIMALGHARGSVFSYEFGKSRTVGVDSLVIVQSSPHAGRGSRRDVRLEIATEGVVTIDSNVTGRSAPGPLRSIGQAHQITKPDLRVALKEGFSFLSALYAEADAFKRHQAFRYSLALTGIGYRKMVEKLTEGSSYTMSVTNPERVIAFSEPRRIPRPMLEQPEDEIVRIITSFERQLNE